MWQTDLEKPTHILASITCKSSLTKSRHLLSSGESLWLAVCHHSLRWLRTFYNWCIYYSSPRTVAKPRFSLLSLFTVQWYESCLPLTTFIPSIAFKACLQLPATCFHCTPVSHNYWTRISRVRSSGQNTSCASSTRRKETGKSLTPKHPSVLQFTSKLHLCLIPCNPVVCNWKITVMHLIFHLFYVIWNCSEYVTVTSAPMQKIFSAAISWRFCWGTGQSVSVLYLECSIHTAADFQQKRLNSGEVMSSLMEER